MWRGLSGADVLRIWEAGHGLPSGARALLVLAAAAPAAAPEALERLPLGARDRALLAIRAATLGERLNAFADCPACAAALEFPVDVDALLAGGAPDEAVEPRAIRVEGYHLTVRPPDSRDQAAAERCPDAATAEALLFAACVTATGEDDRPIPVTALPAVARAAASDVLIALDPLTDVSFDVACPACGCGWSLALDVPAFLWDEIGHHARRLIGEVALLARAYGWSEREILAMSPTRRQSYLAWAG
ncbi:hypothetical protein J2X65_000611 [Ancylobacter sp. 3268]|uniref:T4 family baseplate hub assembly chaperone n=1 Tax=Ancylobacter sp. 3268 TaxID=2817752 RepID=UPI00285A2B79|nr:hypothetical protein [Ancylobacter sp. 3268]MDR6951263.1 hypothetical protein [Ancylobacter sp. 3268]